jgi:hypothetical protein
VEVLFALVGAVFTLAAHHALPSNTFLACLLAHVFEFVVELVALTDVSVRSRKGDAFPNSGVGSSEWDLIRRQH